MPRRAPFSGPVLTSWGRWAAAMLLVAGVCGLWSLNLSRVAAQGTKKPAQKKPGTSSKKPSSKPNSKTGPAKTAAGQQVAAAGWPGFRGPDGMGAVLGKPLPTEWEEDDLAWKTSLPGAGASSPVVFGDRVYLTAYTGFFVPGEEGDQQDLKRHLLAIDLKSGEIVWNRESPATLPEEERIRDHGFAASTPAVDETSIYVFFGKSGVLAFDHQGNLTWQTGVGERTHEWGSSASPVLYKDLVIINASVESDALVALDKHTGDEKWRAEGIKEAWNTPVLVKADSGRQELVMAKQGKVLSFDPDTGKELWNCDTDIGWYMVPSIVAADGVVYCLGGRSGVASLAVRAGGEGDVTRTHRLWTSQKGSNVSSPVIHEGHLYWVNDSRGICYCAKADTGEIVYEEQLERAEQFYASALLAGGNLYYVSRIGQTYVLPAKPTFSEPKLTRLDDRSVFNATPAVAGSRLLIRSDKFLYCVGK